MIELLKRTLRNTPRLYQASARAYNRLKLMQRKAVAAKSAFVRVEDVKSLAAERGWKYVANAPAAIQKSIPSRCLMEDAHWMVRNGSRNYGKHERSMGDREFTERMLYANLVSVKRYPTRETFTCEIPDVFVGIPVGPAITNQFEALIQSTRMDWREVALDRIPAESERLKGRYVSLAVKGDSNYGHWIVDSLPRLALLEEGYEDLKFIIRDGSPRFQKISLTMLGIPEERIVALKDGWHRVEQFVLTHHAQRAMVPIKTHLFEIRRRLLKAAWGEAKKTRSDRRVYISRAKSRRKISNEEEILPLIRDWGFEVVYAEDLSLKEQIILFNETAVLLSPHGSGLNNQVFCEPGTKMFELYNPRRYNWCVRELANTMGHEHWFMFTKNVGAYDMEVDPKKLEKLFNYAFDSGDAVDKYY